jgi:hypothetical protein
MKILSVYDKEFARYGHVITGYDVRELLETLDQISPLPEIGTEYVPGNPVLEALPVAKQFAVNEYGGMPIQLGMCWGYNKALNCLEYHRNSEINIGTTDFVLLLAKQEKIIDGMLDTADVKAFSAPAGTVVEVYATSLHYAPCRDNEEGFRVAIVLPKNTNTDIDKVVEKDPEDKMLWARNKWLLAHPDSSEASQGAYIGLKGENVTI